MYLVLFAVGLLITAAGFVTIGFGIPINAFSLGNTLIIAGTVAVVGGLILIGLGAAIRQLNRIAEALNSRPLARPAACCARALPSCRTSPTRWCRRPPACRKRRAHAAAGRPKLRRDRAAVAPSRVSRLPPARPRPARSTGCARSRSPQSEAPPVAAEPPVDGGRRRGAAVAARAAASDVLAAAAAPSPGIEPPAEPKAWMPPSRGNGTHEPIHKEPSFKEPRRIPPISAPRSEQSPAPMRRERHKTCGQRRRQAGRQGRRTV